MTHGPENEVKSGAGMAVFEPKYGDRLRKRAATRKTHVVFRSVYLGSGDKRE